MSEGIHYEWEVESKIPGLDDAIKKLAQGEATIKNLGHETDFTNEALVKHAGHVGKATDAWHKHHYEMDGVGKSIREVKGRFMEFGEAVGAVLVFEGIKEITEKVIELGGEILKAAGEAERMGLALKLTVGEEGAKEVLEWIDRISSKTRFTDDQLKGWANQLLRSGIAMKDVDQYIAAGLDLNAKGGDMGTAMEALTRAHITGKIGTRQLVGLGIGVDQIATLPGYKGLDRKSLLKKIEEGSITEDQLLDIIAGKDKILGDLGVKGGQDFETKLKNLRTLPEQYWQKFAESPAFEALKGKMSEIFDSLDPGSDRGERIFASLERAFTKLVDIVTDIDFADTIQTDVIPALETMAGIIKSVAESVMQMVDGVHEFGRLVHDYTPIGFAQDQAAKADSYESRRKAGTLFSDQDHGSVANWVNRNTPIGLLNDVVDVAWDKMFGGGKDAGAAMMSGVVVGVSDGTPTAAMSVEDAGQSSINAMQSKLESHSPSKVFERFGRSVGDGFTIGIRDSMSGVDDVTKGAFAIPVPSGSPSVASAGGIQVEINVSVDGHGASSGRELGQQIAETIRPIVESQLADAIERMNGATGVAN